MSLCYFSAGMLRFHLSPLVFATVMSGNLNKPEYQTQPLEFVGTSELRKGEGKHSAPQTQRWVQTLVVQRAFEFTPDLRR